MTFSNRGGYGGNRGQNYGGRSFDRGSERPTLYDAVCAKCGVDCQVPFRPNGRKEVFCSKCFKTNGGGESRNPSGFRDSRDSRSPRRFEKRDSVGTYFPDKQLFDAVCDECRENCKVPFQPRNGNPVLCSNCFGNKKDGGSSRSSSSSFTRSSRDNSIDLEAINSKLDKIIKLLTPKEPKEVSKEITEKILEEIESGTETKLAKSKKKAKVSSKKKD